MWRLQQVLRATIANGTERVSRIAFSVYLNSQGLKEKFRPLTDYPWFSKIAIKFSLHGLIHQFGDIESDEMIFTSKAGLKTSQDGIINSKIEKEKIYRLCFNSTDTESKMVAFDYLQTHRKPHFTKSNYQDIMIVPALFIQNQTF